MSLGRFIQVLAVVTMLAPVDLPGQILPKPQQNMYWHNNGVVYQEWDKAEYTFQGPGKGGKGIHKVPDYLLPDSLDCFDGVYWATAKRERGDGGRILDVYWSPSGSQWFLAAVLDAPKGSVPCRIMPLDTGLFLVESLQGFHQGKQHSFLATATLSQDQKLSIKEILDPNLKKPLFQQDRRGAWEVHPGCAALSTGYGYLVARSEDAILMADGKLGWIWLVETRKQNPGLRLVRLYPAIDESYLDRPFGRGLEMGILGIQPRKNGHFLIAARSEQAVLHGRDFEKQLEPTRNVHDRGTFARNASLAEGRRMSVSSYPELEWWDLDPVGGQLTREPTPAGLPKKFTSPGEIESFRFRIDINDRVIGGD